MAIFDVAQWVVQQSSGIITGTTAIDATTLATMQSTLEAMEEGTVETPSRADALMMYRMMQDIVLWIYQTKEV